MPVGQGALQLVFKLTAQDQGASTELKALMKDTAALDVQVRGLAKSLGLLPSEAREVVARFGEMASTSERLKNALREFGAMGVEMVPKLETMARQTEVLSRQQEQLAATTQKTTTTFQGAGQSMQAFANQAAAMGGAPAQGIAQLSNAISSLGPAGIGAGAALLALAGTVGVLSSTISSVSQLAQQMRNVSLETGFTTEMIAGISIAAEASGSSLDRFTQAFLRMERNATEGSEAVRHNLALLNVTASELERDPVAAFDHFLERFNAMGAGAERNGLLISGFGRDIGRQIPLLVELSGGLEQAKKHAEDLGLVMDKQTVDSMHKMNQAMADLHATWEAFQVQVAKPFIQYLLILDDLIRSLPGGFKSLTFAIEASLRVLFPWMVPLQAMLVLLERIKGQASGAIDRIPFGEPPTGAEKFLTGEAAFQAFGQPGKGVKEKKPKKGKKAAEDISEETLEANRAERDLADARRERSEDLDRITQKSSDQQEELNRQVKTTAITSLEFVDRLTTALTDSYAQRLQAEKDLAGFQERAFAAEQARIESDTHLLPRQRADALEALEEKRKVAADARISSETKANEQLEKGFETAGKTLEKMIDDMDKDTAKVDDMFTKWGEAASRVFSGDLLKGRIKVEDVLPEEAGKPILTMEDQIISKVHEQALAVSGLEAAWINVRNAVQGVVEDWSTTTSKDLGLNTVTSNAEAIGSTVGQMGKIGTKAFNDMGKAIGATVAQWVMAGKTGPAAMRTILAATLAAVAQEAIVKAVESLALGFQRLAEHDYPAAGHAFIAAGLWASLAVGSALVGRAVAPAQGGGATGAAGGTTPPQNTTINVGAGGPSLGLTPEAAFGVALQNHAAAINTQNGHLGTLAAKISSMSPGDVVTVAADSHPGAFATGVTNATQKDASFTRQLGMTLLPSH
jgi:hypothetical protein